MEEIRTVREYLDGSKQCLSVQRIVCKEMLRDGAERPKKVNRVGIATFSLEMKNITKKLGKKRKEHEWGKKLTTIKKVAANLTLVGGTTALAAIAAGPLAPAVLITGSVVAIGTSAKIMLSDFVFDSIIKKNEKEYNEHADQIIASEFQRRFEQGDAELAELKQKIEDGTATSKDVIEKMLQEEDVYSDSSVLKNVSEDQKPEMLFQLTKAVERRANNLASFLNDRVDHVDAKVTKLEGRVEGITKFVTQHWKETNQQFEKIAKNMGEVKKQLKEVNGRVIANRQDITKNASDIGYLQSFTYENMSPDQQLRALDSGFFKGLPAGDKEKLEAKAQAAKSRREVIDTLNTMAAGAALAGRVGELLDLPEDIQKAISVAGTALETAAQFASGNYIGAAMSALSLFGSKKRPDPAAQRHKQVMKALGKLLKGQNEILDGQKKLAENQQKLMEGQFKIMQGVAQLGEWIQQNHKEVMDKLTVIHGEILINRLILRDSVLQPGLIAGRIFLRRRTNPDYEFDAYSGEFASYNHVAKHFKGNWKNFWDFWDEFEKIGGGTDNHVHAAIQMASNDTRINETKDFREKLMDPAINLLNKCFENNGTKLNSALLGLMVPWNEVDALKTKNDDLKDAVDLHENRSLERVSHFLTTPLEADVVLEYGRVALQSHHYFSLLKEREQRIEELMPLHSAKQAEDGWRKGAEILKDYATWVDLCIAQQSVIAGDGIIPSMYTNVVANDAQHYDHVMKALESNRLLRENFAIYLMQEELDKSGHNTLSYRFAIESGFSPVSLFKSDKWRLRSRIKKIMVKGEWIEGKDEWLDQTVKGTEVEIDGVTVTVQDEKTENTPWALRLSDKVRLDLPHPTALEEGIMRHTPDTPQLLAMRRSIAEVLMEYDYPDWSQEKLSKRERESFQQLLVYSVEHLIPEKEEIVA